MVVGRGGVLVLHMLYCTRFVRLVLPVFWWSNMYTQRHLPQVAQRQSQAAIGKAVDAACCALFVPWLDLEGVLVLRMLYCIRAQAQVSL